MEEQCDCMQKTSLAIIDHFKKEKEYSGHEVVEAEWEHRSLFPKVRMYVCFIIKSTFIKKNGTKSRIQNHHVNIFFTYCPFCGKKIIND